MCGKDGDPEFTNYKLLYVQGEKTRPNENQIIEFDQNL